MARTRIAESTKYNLRSNSSVSPSKRVDAPKSKKICKEEKPAQGKVDAGRGKKGNQSKKQDRERQTLEVGLIMDCTGSMQTWIDRSKATLK